MKENERVLALHGAAVWRTICRLLGGQEGAADCFQDVFVRYTEIARKSTVENAQGLLKRLATRAAIDEIRRRIGSRKRNAELDDQQPSGDCEPWESAAANELGEGLRVALGEISEDQATIFCMTQLEGMDHGETAEAMGIDAKHVAVLLHRARANLQGRLAKYLPAAGRRI